MRQFFLDSGIGVDYGRGHPVKKTLIKVLRCQECPFLSQSEIFDREHGPESYHAEQSKIDEHLRSALKYNPRELKLAESTEKRHESKVQKSKHSQRCDDNSIEKTTKIVWNMKKYRACWFK